MTFDPLNFTLEVGEPQQFNLDVDGGDNVGLGLDTAIVVNQLEGGSLPIGGVAGDIVIKRSSANFDAEWVTPATSAEQDNTRPITSAAVYTEIGNINALLATI